MTPRTARTTGSRRSVFAAPGESTRGRWRALGEVAGGALLMVLTQQVVHELGDSSSGELQFLLGAAVLALLAVRRRLPTASLLGVSAAMGLLPAAGLPAAVTAYTAARQLAAPRRRTAVLLASTALTMLVCAVFAPGAGLGSHTFGLALGGVLAATTLIVPGLVGTSGGQQDRLLEALRERAAAAESARRHADSESRIHERSRIAAEMHDLVGHRLSLISLHTGGLEMALESQSPELRDEAALVRRASGDAMRELREVLGVLGPLGRDTGTGALTDTTGTRSDVEALAEESRSGGIPVELTWEGPDLHDRAAQVRRAVHRVVRESLTNVHRYATGAHVTVSVTHTDDAVDVLVRNGAPPVPPEASTGLGSGRGLVGLRERVALLGGTLEAEPTPAGGFAVTTRIPAQPEPGAVLANEGAGPVDPLSEPLPEAHSGRTGARLQRRAVGALTGLLGLAGVGVMMLFGLLLVSEAAPEPGQSEPEEPRIGMSRKEVQDAVYPDQPEVRAAATGREPARPESVTFCMYPSVPFDDYVPLDGPADPESATPVDPYDHEGAGRLRITRYCFRGDKLAAIDRFTVPVVAQTPPWETP
ncbi:two-component sensor histidine kinase [Streptomyces armeniacus]|uniref:histidine kinase n=1 Tax=Streptomyces armeniacus TaxID=83291 RepID=A0A345XPJ6_9ACTN|nr:histidine kinase [Streptomyces armeniacus]AXK33562.1 two-component sensor histidine kinase [Streptomyces armeniacus]